VIQEQEIDVWLRGGGLVVAASERAARFLVGSYHRARRSEGLKAWVTPSVLDWRSFIRNEWTRRSRDERLLLSSVQEQSIWTRILSQDSQTASLLEGPRYRIANLAIQAHQLLCDYAPHLLGDRARRAWQHDPGEFSSWLREFDSVCRKDGLLSVARAPLELIDLLESDRGARPPILLAGFDRILPTERRVFAAWSTSGEVREAQLAPSTPQVHFYQAADPDSELAACAIWCRRQLAANPDARLLVVAQDISDRRGEYERAFLRFASAAGRSADAEKLFEISLGIPLAQTGLVRSACLLVRWLTGPIEEHELDWLFSSGHTAASQEETLALTAFMRALRRKRWQRIRWQLADFLRQRPGAELPRAWAARVLQAHRRLFEANAEPKAPFTWAELVPQLLAAAGWPGTRTLSSLEFQILLRWQATIESCATLGFAGRAMTWPEFFEVLDRAAHESLFAPESTGAPILIAGPAESAGLTADAIWVLGADEENWPPRGSTNPLLPLAVQREAGMPHSSPQADWDLAAATRQRLMASAGEVRFSYAKQAKGIDKRPSRLIDPIAAARPLPAEFSSPPLPQPAASSFLDWSQVPFPSGAAAGGANILTFQSQCAFKAFATVRLAARTWEPAETGLTVLERGLLLHDAMHRIWAGPPEGIRTHAELASKTNLEAFVTGHVRALLSEKTPLRARDGMPPRYLELEAKRLTALISEWLRYEEERLPFAVEQTEAKSAAAIGGLQLNLRLDRVDRLNDGSLLVIDYKTGDVSPKSWDPPRPGDLQLPLYAVFGLGPAEGEIGGLVFAKLRAGECEFAGKVRHAATQLKADLNRGTNLVTKPLSRQEMAAWRRKITELAEDFLAGRADVDPRDNETCKQCGLHAVCRIEETRAQTAEGALEAGDE